MITIVVWGLPEKMSGLDSLILQPCHTVQHDPCNLPLLRGAQRFPAGRTAAAVLHLRVRARGDGQAHDRGARDTAHRGRAGTAQRRVGGLRAGVFDSDRLAVYPKFEALDISPLLKVRAQPLRVLRFVADAHLGGLASLLRMSGFDTLYDNGFEDGEIAEIAAQQGRIVLTRDRELLKRRIISHGCYVHALKPSLQLRELYERLDLARSARPFSLCLHCNLPLHEISPELARPQVPPRIGALYSHFLHCDACQRVYWEGSHWRGMCALLAPLLDR